MLKYDGTCVILRNLGHVKLSPWRTLQAVSKVLYYSKAARNADFENRFKGYLSAHSMFKHGFKSSSGRRIMRADTRESVHGTTSVVAWNRPEGQILVVIAKCEEVDTDLFLAALFGENAENRIAFNVRCYSKHSFFVLCRVHRWRLFSLSWGSRTMRRGLREEQTQLSTARLQTVHCSLERGSSNTCISLLLLVELCLCLLLQSRLAGLFDKGFQERDKLLSGFFHIYAESVGREWAKPFLKIGDDERFVSIIVQRIEVVKPNSFRKGDNSHPCLVLTLQRSFTT
mmetsp:Transcript_11191/g.19705  ORF Transcript_11191/g.19705 Transcript_11191/m.19705 type:complete len:285 (-) Transcript_11191:49-903(-)